VNIPNILRRWGGLRSRPTTVAEAMGVFTRVKSDLETLHKQALDNLKKFLD